MLLAFSAGLLLAVTASGAIAGERVTLGRLAFGLLANAAATFAVIVVASTTMHRRGALAALIPQVLGAIVGVAVVHLLLRREALPGAPWLSERPAQLVNDAVAVSCLLALAWASARDLDVRLLVLAFLVVTAYRVTASMWHVDQAPGGFQATVQQLVVAQLVGAAIALAVWRSLRGRPSEDSR
jgi:uncharacterized membrane protein YeaQ/YmgE (transglycosylase-associated protein family)